MSPSGLQKFLDGATPYTMTRQKLERWYVREAARYGGGPGTGSALAALQILIQDLPAAGRDEAAIEILDLLESAYRRRRRRSPGWLAELRREFGDAG